MAVAPPMMISDQEGVLPADDVADPPEEQGAERPDDEAHGKRRQVGDQRERVVSGRIEERRDDAGQASKDIEVAHSIMVPTAEAVMTCQIFESAGTGTERGAGDEGNEMAPCLEDLGRSATIR